MANVKVNLDITELQELVGLGFRAYAFGDFYNAAAAFGRATYLLAEKNGYEHESLGELYIQYAKSLLKLSRKDTEEPSSEEDIVDSNCTTKKEVTVKHEEPNEEDAYKKEEDESKLETKEDKEVGKTNGEPSSKQEEETQEEMEAEEKKLTDLQLAWEVLEVAKRIFTNRDSRKMQLAEILILLGEVAIENENFQVGINDMKAGIDMQKPTSWKQWKLAEHYYKLGIAHSTRSNINAAKVFKNSIEIFKEEEMTLELLQAMAGSAESPENKDKPNDISHLGKRKRKADDDSGEGDGKPSKKPTP